MESLKPRALAFEQYFPGIFLAGPGARSQLPILARSMGKRLLFLTGGSSLEKSGKLGIFLDGLNAEGFTILLEGIDHEPRVEDVDALSSRARSHGIGGIIAVGGGSVLDLAKAVAAMFGQSGSVQDYLEGLGSKKHPGGALPWIALPTTAGTGSEMTSNAVIRGQSLAKTGEARPFKKSLRHGSFLPTAVIVDPELQEGMPHSLAISSAFDALAQLLEAASSRRANPLTDAYVFEGLRLIAPALDALLAGRAMIEDRLNLSLAASFSGIGITGAGLGLPHGIAGNLGALRDIPHGLACALLLEPCFRLSLSRLGVQSGELEKRFARIASALGSGLSGSGPAELLALLKRWTAQATLPSLASFGFTAQELASVAAASTSRDSLIALGPEAAALVLSELSA